MGGRWCDAGRLADETCEAKQTMSMSHRAGDLALPPQQRRWLHGANRLTEGAHTHTHTPDTREAINTTLSAVERAHGGVAPSNADTTCPPNPEDRAQKIFCRLVGNKIALADV